MKRALRVIVYLLLLAVVISSVHSIWIAFTEQQLYLAVFPGAHGALFWIINSASLVAGLNCILIALQVRWAIFVNPLIGIASIVLIEVVGGPRMNEIVVFVACTLTTALPWYLWMRQSSDMEPTGSSHLHRELHVPDFGSNDVVVRETGVKKRADP